MLHALIALVRVMHACININVHKYTHSCIMHTMYITNIATHASCIPHEHYTCKPHFLIKKSG